MKRIREYLAGKTPKQRVLIFIGAALLIVFIFFVIKGNLFDKHVSNNPPQSVSQSENSSSEGTNSEQSETAEGVKFHINWIDISVLAALAAAYGIHKYRKPNEKRGYDYGNHNNSAENPSVEKENFRKKCADQQADE